jgi:hypothetical protein
MGFIQDYLTIVCVTTILAVIWYVFFMTTAKLDKFGKPIISNASKPPEENIVKRI